MNRFLRRRKERMRKKKEDIKIEDETDDDSESEVKELQCENKRGKNNQENKSEKDKHKHKGILSGKHKKDNGGRNGFEKESETERSRDKNKKEIKQGQMKGSDKETKVKQSTTKSKDVTWAEGDVTKQTKLSNCKKFNKDKDQRNKGLRTDQPSELKKKNVPISEVEKEVNIKLATKQRKQENNSSDIANQELSHGKRTAKKQFVEEKEESYDDDEEEEDGEEEEEEDSDDDDNNSDEDDVEDSDSETERVEGMFSLDQSSQHSIPLEHHAKFYQDRALNTERFFGQFCQLFGSITRKIARTRDKGDLLSKQLIDYAKQEKISHSSSKNLTEFAHNLAAVQDYRDAEIRRLETKVVKPLSAYGPKCKQIKQLVKREQGAIKREIKQRKNLEKVRDKKPGDAHSIAETEVRKAAESAQIGLKGLQTQMCTFEKEKLSDLKTILADFVSIELVFHAKAIEFYSQCFDNLAMIDEEMDLEEFQRKISLGQGAMSLGPQAPVPTGTATSIASQGMMSTMGSTGTSEYTSTGASYTYTYGDSTTSSSDKRVRIQTQSMYNDDDDDDEDDDEYEDDDDEDEADNYSRPVRR